MDKPRLRFAPSPTGYLHVGGVRTALFNWLWARHTGGTFVLRIEDTDQARSTRESVTAIFEALRWLGIDWDEGPTGPEDEGGGPHGPYFQMKRLALYREYAQKLVASGHAFRCYCTREEQEAEKKAQFARGKKNYEHECPSRDKREERDLPFVVRYKASKDGAVDYEDLVFGKVHTPNTELQDFVLLRSDGVPLYNFGCVIDDLTMGITLVARGRDHLINTPPQLLLYSALGAKPPQFAHLPMMMANKSEKLSKRVGSVSTTEYRDKGYLADGLLSYLVRFGWSHGDEEVFSKARLIELFDWSHTGKADGVYDFKKCLAINQKYLQKNAPEQELLEGVVPFLAARGLTVSASDPKLLAALRTVRPKADTLVSLADVLDFYFREEPVLDPAAAQKCFVPEAAPMLELLTSWVEAVESFDEATLKSTIEAALAEKGLALKDVATPSRVALTGRTASPGLYEMLAVLGREAALKRLRAGAARCKA